MLNFQTNIRTKRIKLLYIKIQVRLTTRPLKNLKYASKHFFVRTPRYVDCFNAFERNTSILYEYILNCELVRYITFFHHIHSTVILIMIQTIRLSFKLQKYL